LYVKRIGEKPIIFAVHHVGRSDLLVHVIYSAMMTKLIVQAYELTLRAQFTEHLVGGFIAEVVDCNDVGEY
jgi:hypothetical protein